MYFIGITERAILELHLMTGENHQLNEKKKVKGVDGGVRDLALQVDAGMHPRLLRESVVQGHLRVYYAFFYRVE